MRLAARFSAIDRPSHSVIIELSGLCFLSLLVYYLAYFSVMSGAVSDPRYTLIVSQAILNHGTIELNEYQDELIWGLPADFDADPNILNINGRYYNYFPVGPSLLSVPFVYIANTIGWDMLTIQGNTNVQRLLSSLSVVLVAWLLYGLVRTWVKPGAAFIITAVTLLGTTFISTLGTALWSINFSVVFVGIALLLVVRYDAGTSGSIHSFLLGASLFLGYMMRASVATFIVVIFLYLLIRDRRAFLITATVAAALLVLSSLWSYQEFGRWLPIYYGIERLQIVRSPLWVALTGHLLSPSRGLLVVSPFLLLLIPGSWLARRCLKANALFWLCGLWFALHLFVASRATIWWGGHSFGPRILTELNFTFAIVAALIWRSVSREWTDTTRRRAIFLFCLLSSLSIYIHSYQGLYNYATSLWNVVTEPRSAPPFTPPFGDLFNWRYPQPFIGNNTLCQLERERAEAIMSDAPNLLTYEWERPLTFSTQATINAYEAAINYAHPRTIPPTQYGLFVGWEPVIVPRAPYPSTGCDEIHLYLALSDPPVEESVLVLRSAAYLEQRAEVYFNDQFVGETVFREQTDFALETARFTLNSSAFHPNAINKISVRLPDAQRAVLL